MWKTLSSKIVHKNNWYCVKRNDVVLPNKNKATYFIVSRPGSSLIVPVKGNKIILEKQYRYQINKWFIELPCGGVKKNSTYLKTAVAELREELGYKAKNLKSIGQFAPYNGVSNEICRVYLATGLKYIGSRLEGTELIKPLEVEIEKVYRMVDTGKIQDGMALAGLLLARKYLIKNL
jgi:ADP-ribose pyrophosphatase